MKDQRDIHSPQVPAHAQGEGEEYLDANTPWSTRPPGITEYIPGTDIVDADGQLICDTPDQTVAQAIVKAVNRYNGLLALSATVEGLVEALEGLANATDAFMNAATEGEHVKAQAKFPVGESLVWTLKDKVTAARTALAQVRGEGVE